MTQKEKIISYLARGKKLTALQALNLFGCFRLAARINDIKKEGYNVQRDMIVTKSSKKVAQYYLV